jgi:hypothetical protein
VACGEPQTTPVSVSRGSPLVDKERRRGHTYMSCDGVNIICYTFYFIFFTLANQEQIKKYKENNNLNGGNVGNVNCQLEMDKITWKNLRSK